MVFDFSGVDNRRVALAHVVTEIESEAAKLGWDRPTVVYALVPTRTILADSDLPQELRTSLQASLEANPESLTAVVQEDLDATDLVETLPLLSWGEEVFGMAICMERISVPPAAEEGAPTDPDQAAAYFANHPQREDIRIVAAVDRAGNRWGAIRSRRLDNEDSVVTSSDLFPELFAALADTFRPDEDVDHS